MTQTTDRLAEVLDCDREAGEVFAKGPHVVHYLTNTKLEGDWQTALTEAFARHRITSTQSLSTDLDEVQQRIAELERVNARLREALWKIERNEDAAYSRDLARAALNQPKESGHE